jgi:hypothetical protein
MREIYDATSGEISTVKLFLVVSLSIVSSLLANFLSALLHVIYYDYI